MLCVFVGAPVSEGGVEPLVVEPPHVPVQVVSQLFEAGAPVAVYEFLLQQAVGRFDHGVVVGFLLRDRERRMSNVSSSSSILALSNSLPLSVWKTSISVRGNSSVANAASTRSAVRFVPVQWPAIARFARSMGRHTYAPSAPDPHVCQVRSPDGYTAGSPRTLGPGDSPAPPR